MGKGCREGAQWCRGVRGGAGRCTVKNDKGRSRRVKDCEKGCGGVIRVKVSQWWFKAFTSGEGRCGGVKGAEGGVAGPPRFKEMLRGSAVSNVFWGVQRSSGVFRRVNESFEVFRGVLWF